MKKRILSVLLSVVVATTISSAVPMSVQAETTAVKTAAQSANTTYGSNTNIGEIDAKDIKEWKDKRNEADVYAGWYRFKGEYTGWQSVGIQAHNESSSSDYVLGTTFFTMETWKKSGSTYEKLMEKDYSTGIDDSQDFYMEKGTDYYIYMGGVSGCNADLTLQGAGTIYAYDAKINEPASCKVLSEETPQQINAASPEDVQWLKFVVPEDGKYKLSYKEENNASRVQLFGSSNGGLTYKAWYSHPTDDRSYYDLKKGEVCYLACTSFKGKASYKVSVKKVTVKEIYANKDQAFSLRKSTKASAVAAAQAKTSIDYLNKIYTPNPSFATRIDHADQQDIAAFKKMAEIITKGCETDKEKVEAITKWVKNNIEYDTTVSSYSTAVFHSRKGDCQGMSMLIADFCRSLGMPVAYASGWKADLTLWTIDDLYHSDDRHDFAGHGWDMIYFDGKWHMYDVLFDNYDVTGSDTMAEKGYYFAFIEGMPIAGDDLDPALAGMDVGSMLVTPCYYQGNFVTLVYGCLSDREYQYEIDQDGDTCKEARMGGTIRHQNLAMEDQFFPTMTSNVVYFPYSDEISSNGNLYDDGRKDPDAGYLYTNGWICGQYLADKDGILRNMDLQTIGDKTYYFEQSGDAQMLNMNADQYYMYKGQLYIKTGAAGSIIPKQVEEYLNDSEYEISTNIRSASDWEGNDVDGSTLINFSGKECTIKTLKAGYVWYEIQVNRKSDNANLINAQVQINITDQKKPTYSFEDTPVSSNEDSKPDDNQGNNSNNDKNNSSDNNKNNTSGTNSGQTTKTNPSVQKATLTQTSYIYDGKVKNPAVKVFDSNGTQLSSKDYTVSKATGRKNVGKYKYTITFKNEYKGEKARTLYFTINPKPTKLTSLKKGSKRFTAKWKKVSAQASGYQIRYSMKSSMAGSKVLTVKSYKTTSKKITRLKKKKKYYVQVRTYKTVSKVKYYSGWSGKKTIVTK